MDETVSPTPRIEVLWRPGYPYCAWLRRGLERAGIDTVERDIWSDPGAAARVRAATGGDETVPTVIVGSRALVNPSVAQGLRGARGVPGRRGGTRRCGADDRNPSAGGRRGMDRGHRVGVSTARAVASEHHLAPGAGGARRGVAVAGRAGPAGG
ncbi:MAG: glutaredoxin family protein [Pseudonocardiaceae bacterium]